MNNLALQALSGKNRSGRPPLWLMRQAGRYMHEYQAIRKRHDLLTLFRTPELITEVTKLPIDAFGFDAAIVFSDILLISEALGFTLRFEEAVGPIIDPPLSPEADFTQLVGRDIVGSLQYVYEAIRQLKRTLTVPLIGFAGAPFTLATYLIEGGSSRLMRKTKRWFFQEPESFTRLLDILAMATIEHLNAQIDAGVDAIQIFDSWANVLPAPQFQAFAANFMDKVMKGLKPCPIILFCRGSSLYAHELAAIKPQGISLDWQADLPKIRSSLGKDICLQGNLDPDILLTSPSVVRKEALRIMEQMRDDPAFIFNLGHGILPETPRANVEALIACVRDF
ncbi:MAG: uroporphyrinogen decarboxylase [Verrucomicrobia bacterium]|nr:uroporphyrinogen decarboxylase [Verrucomicrobiota bacterium]